MRELLECGEPITVLDIRRAAQREEWSIPGSVHTDVCDALWAGDDDALSGTDLPSDRPVVTVCAVGSTSLLAAAVVQVRRTGKGCLSYLVGSGGEAAVIDPSAEVDVYARLARERGWRIARVIETHVRADHLSRARRLAREAEAELHLPEQDRVKFPFHAVTLFVDSVGRPDLKAADRQRPASAPTPHTPRCSGSLPCRSRPWCSPVIPANPFRLTDRPSRRRWATCQPPSHCWVNRRRPSWQRCCSSARSPSPSLLSPPGDGRRCPPPPTG